MVNTPRGAGPAVPRGEGRPTSGPWPGRQGGATARHLPGGPPGPLVPPVPEAALAAGPRPARLLFVNQYYWPDHASTAQHLTDLVESLAAEGHECHVLCAQGGYRPGDPRPPAFETHNGVHIHRVPTTSLGRRSTLRRMVDYLSFYARALMMAVWLPRCDAVITLTTPPIIGLIGTLLRRLRGTRHIYWSMDLHPDASLALGLLSRRNPLVAWLAWLSDAVYRRADKVVVLGPYMADRVLAKRVRPERVATVPVWSRREEIYPVARVGHPMRTELGLDGRFVVMYSGNLGLAHTADEFLEAARRLRGREEVVFLFVGDGPRMAALRRTVEAEGPGNVRFLDYFAREQLHLSLSLADAHLISMRSEMTGIVVPGKLYGVMAAGRPALFVGPAHCETADTVRQAGCGLTVRLGDASGLVEAIETLIDQPETARAMGDRGRAAFLTAHERAGCCDSWSALVSELLNAPAAHRPAVAAEAGPPAPANLPSLAGTA